MSGSDIYASAAQPYGFDPLFLRAMAIVESGEHDDAVSPAGAQGRMQLMPPTAAGVGVRNAFDPAQAVAGAAKHMNDLLDQANGDPVTALQLYHAGPDRSGWGPKTQAYPGKVAQVYAQLRAQAGGNNGTNATAEVSRDNSQSANVPIPPAAVETNRAPQGGSNRASMLRDLGLGADGSPLPAQGAAATPVNAARASMLRDLGLAEDGSALPQAQPAAQPQASSSQWRQVAPWRAPDGTMTTIAPEDYQAFVSGGSPASPTPARADLLRDLGVTEADIDPITHRPRQEMRAQPPEGQTIQVWPAQEGNQPGPATQVIANLPTDTDARRRIFAARLFPDMPLDQAVKRINVGQGGRLVASPPNGAPFFVDPAPVDLSATNTDLPGDRSLAHRLTAGDQSAGNLVNRLASGIPGAAAPAAGMLAGTVTSPTSLVVAPLVAGAAAAGADQARQYLASLADPGSNGYRPNWTQTGGEALQSGVGQLGGSVLNRAFIPNPLRLGRGEVSALRTPAMIREARDAYERAGAQGVNLTPGQATGMPSLLQYEDATTTMPGTVDRAAAFYRSQGNQLAAAGGRMLNNISPLADKNAAAAAFQGGSEDAIRLARQNANAAARPAYEAAQRGGQVMSPDLAQLADQPAVKSAMEQARAAYQNLYRTPAPETPDFALWDLTKRSLDDMVGQARRAGDRTGAMAMDSLRGDLTTHLDAAYPTYPAARAAAAPGQQLASQLEESGVGSVANMGGDERARAIVAPVFAQNNPQAISAAREAFAAAGRSNEWMAGVRAYIQDAFDRASMSQQGLNPSMLRRQIWGNVDNREAIRAALTPKQYEGFDNFMRTVEDVAQTFPTNSLTATRQNARASLAGAGEGQGNVKALDTIAAAFSPQVWMHAGQSVLSGARQRMVQGNMNRLVDFLFSPDGLQLLEATAAYSPTTAKARSVVAQAVTRAIPSRLAAPANGGAGAEPNRLAAPTE